MFAMAWQGRDGAWLARDRYGKIPLYYAEHDGGYVFASELKAFDLSWGVRPKAVPPGCAVRLATGEVVRWDAGVVAPPCEPEGVLAMLREGVRKRLISDRPVCFLLSGGLDSSLVLSLAKELHPEPVAYTAVYDTQSDDLAMARRVALELDVPLVEVQVPRPTPRLIADAVAAVEVPMKAQVEIAMAHLPLMRAVASDGYRVALSGEAADELFCGYGNMMMAAGRAQSDVEYQEVIRRAVDKMSRGNFVRVNKVMMAAGVEGRLPFMEEGLVAAALASTKASNPPGKKVLKAAAYRRGLPAYVIRRKKDTFQGGTGIAAAVGDFINSPTKHYNAEARELFGFLPKE
jgi:asparagine synthase (glutamine-hydrolysing)